MLNERCLTDVSRMWMSTYWPGWNWNFSSRGRSTSLRMSAVSFSMASTSASVVMTGSALRSDSSSKFMSSISRSETAWALQRSV